MIPGVVAGGLQRAVESSGAPAGPQAIGTGTVWRMTVNAMNTDTYVGITEWRFYDINDNLIPVSGAGISYSEGGAGAQGAHGASAPFDGTNATYWLRSGAPSWVQITFPSAKTPYRFEFTNESKARAPIDFTISADGVDVLDIYEPSWDAANVTRSWPQTFAAGQYKAFRINVSASNDASFTLIQEVEMRATVGGADQCTGGAAFGSQNNTNEDASKAFDNVDGNNYDLHIPVTGWLLYGFATPTSVAQYMIRCNNTNSRTPKNWTFEGTIDGVNFDVLDTRTNQSWVVPENKVFTI